MVLPNTCHKFPLMGIEERIVKRSFSKWLVLTCLFFIACNTSKMDSPKSSDSGTYKSIAAEKYGTGIEYLFNEPRTYVVCLKRIKPTAEAPQNQTNFFIYDLGKEKIIFEESSIDAQVKWKNDSQVQVKITPGIVSGDETEDDFIYLYDVKAEKKIK